MNKIEEIENACKKLNIDVEIISKETSMKLIEEIVEKYKPHKLSGHLAIYNDSISIPTSDYEFTFSTYLNKESIYIFFDQENHEKNQVIRIEEGQRLHQIMEESYGMEYFLTNKKMSYLIAVNWYVIEGAGEATEWMKELKRER